MWQPPFMRGSVKSARSARPQYRHYVRSVRLQPDLDTVRLKADTTYDIFTDAQNAYWTPNCIVRLPVSDVMRPKSAATFGLLTLFPRMTSLSLLWFSTLKASHRSSMR